MASVQESNFDFNLVVWDADGVLIDSRTVAWKVSEEILAACGSHVQISSASEYRSLFSRGGAFGEPDTETGKILRSVHRLAMRARASEVKKNADVLHIAEMVSVSSLILTSAYASGIGKALGESSSIFCRIVGREEGRKGDLAMAIVEGRLPIFVTDTVTDITLFRSLGFVTVACAWGYDLPSALKFSGTNYFVETPAELESLLRKLNLLRSDTLAS